MIESSHNGNIVLFLYPIPNSLMEPSLLYKKLGFIIWIKPKINKNKMIDTKVVLFLVNVLNIYYNLINFYNIFICGFAKPLSKEKNI